MKLCMNSKEVTRGTNQTIAWQGGGGGRSIHPVTEIFSKPDNLSQFLFCQFLFHCNRFVFTLVWRCLYHFFSIHFVSPIFSVFFCSTNFFPPFYSAMTFLHLHLCGSVSTTDFCSTNFCSAMTFLYLHLNIPTTLCYTHFVLLFYSIMTNSGAAVCSVCAPDK